jgi:hypothetical protein
VSPGHLKFKFQLLLKKFFIGPQIYNFMGHPIYHIIRQVTVYLCIINLWGQEQLATTRWCPKGSDTQNGAIKALLLALDKVAPLTGDGHLSIDRNLWLQQKVIPLCQTLDISYFEDIMSYPLSRPKKE